MEHLEDYLQHTTELCAVTGISQASVYDYSVSPDAEEYDSAFGFYKENMERTKRHGVYPFHLFFSSEYGSNGAAKKIDDVYVMKLKMGLLHSIKSNSLSKVDQL